ncbi:angiopoietin-related protein 1-like [Anopheles aquasalis]|uniref:angiopoietin-related protein 1-like n=1 Tax=Anopheles aquasalis TaxID=42839 RepID=UPI00215A3D79|nr:angiopoietin-related protein 1-like [Anopheles aquasalis]
MKLRIVLIVFCAVIYVAASDGEPSDGAGTVKPSVDEMLQMLTGKLEAMEHRLQRMEKQLRTVEGSSCNNVSSRVSGTYLIRVKNNSEPFEVYCEQTAFGGGWIVFQYRYDGSLDFYRGWNEFRDGFGDLNKEFWLGLEKVHHITKDRKHELIVELKDFSGTYKYARYRAFEIGSESDQYVLKDLKMFEGTVKNDMADNTGMMFSTKDRDNDHYQARHCAQFHESAWWHEACTYANLNGRYIDAEDYKSMFWWDFKNSRQGLSYSRMMIREVE